MGPFIPILMYHQIDTLPPPGTPFRHLTVPPLVFASQMQWMQKLGYRGLSMHDLQPYLDGSKRARVFGITFDDGYQSVVRNALPVLSRLGFTATNYIVANQIGGTNSWDAQYGIPQVPLMTTDDLRCWIAAGQEIGSHTLDHLDLTTQSLTQAREQIAVSRLRLQELTGRPIDAFCFPYGRFDSNSLSLTRAAGYQNATTIIRGRARPGSDPLRLPRITIDGTAGLAAFAVQLLSPYEDLRAAWQRRRRTTLHSYL